MEDRDNQQEIAKETEKAWLAGFLEGDGYITLSSQLASKKKKDSGLVVVPNIGFTNQDALLIERAKVICEKISGTGGWINEIANNTAYKYPSSNPTIINLSVRKFSACSKILEAIIPYLAGQKLARARLLLSFINRRLCHPRMPYDLDEVGIVKTFVETQINGKNPRHGKTLRKFLRDFVPDVPRPRNEFGQFTPSA